MKMLTQKQKIAVIIGIVVIIAVILYYYINSTKEAYNYEEFAKENQEIEEDTEQTKEEKIIVHVTGAVEKEGIVEVKENARINDIIQAAGGLTEDADLDNVNLAYAVEDGQKIYIPSKLDNSENIDDGDVIMNITSQTAGNNVINENKEKGLININTANIEKLQELPGIGKQTAEKIITYREENRKI